jgi:hypothetical protein
MNRNGNEHCQQPHSTLPLTLLLLCVLLTGCCSSYRYQGLRAPTPQPNRSPVPTSVVQAGKQSFN